MIPILYEKTETAFVSNGLGRLRDCLACTVSEGRNDVYECDFSYPINGAHIDQIVPGRIIGVTHDDTGDIQPFDIVGYSKPIDGIITFHAVHISYRQSGIVARGTNVNSIADAFTALSVALPSNPFNYSTDRPGTGYAAAFDGVPRSVKELLGGIEGSILDTYGGEYLFDRFNVKLLTARGEKKPFTIRYGVNMTDYNEDLDASVSFSSCIPYWTDGTTTIIGDIQTNGETATGRNECAALDVSDKFESQPTKAQVEAAGLAYLVNNQTYAPAQTISVSFARLQDMGYDWLDSLLTCNLCDTITVVFPGHLVADFKIVKTVWDVLAGRYESMELGQLSTSLSQALGISAGGGAATAGGGGSVATEYRSAQKSMSSTLERVSLSSGTTATDVLTVTAPITGYVVVSGYIQITANSTGNRHIQTTVGGAICAQGTQAAHGSQTGMLEASGVYPVTEGDTVALAAWQTSGNTLYAGGLLSALFIGEGGA